MHLNLQKGRRKYGALLSCSLYRRVPAPAPLPTLYRHSTGKIIGCRVGFPRGRKENKSKKKRKKVKEKRGNRLDWAWPWQAKLNKAGGRLCLYEPQLVLESTLGPGRLAPATPAWHCRGGTHYSNDSLQLRAEGLARIAVFVPVTSVARPWKQTYPVYVPATHASTTFARPCFCFRSWALQPLATPPLLF